MTNNIKSELKLFNSLGRSLETFQHPHDKVVTIFTCGPSIYQKAHIGNFRTFLFEDILVRYLEYSGYRVTRGMNFTDIEAKAIEEAKKRRTDVKSLTEDNIAGFLQEMQLLRMKIPEYLPKASESIEESVRIIKLLVEKGIAYWHRGNVYFEPLKFPGFGKLFGLDMALWPTKKRRFHQDTYPGIQWNRGDFILWHGDEKRESVSWDTEIGRGRPAWNIQDPAMIRPYFRESLTIYCGGIDNIYRHHDYTLAILESITDYALATYWLHCQHLFVNGQKMSKSKGNVYYPDTLLSQGYTAAEIRFFLIYGHYGTRVNYSPDAMIKAAAKLRGLKKTISQLEKRAGLAPIKSNFEKAFTQGNDRGQINNRTGAGSHQEDNHARQIRGVFFAGMDSDLNVQEAFDSLCTLLSGWELSALKREEASGVLAALGDLDEVMQVIF
jgi:cysteinyl-tRNA synthetase